MNGKNFLEDSLARRIIFLTGKGGVGKSTLARALLTALERRGKKAWLVDWGAATSYRHGQRHICLKTMECFREYVLKKLKYERLYDTLLSNKVVRAFVMAAPGLPDTVCAGKIWNLSQTFPDDVFVVDLPSTGHTESFLSSLGGVQKIFTKGFIHEESRAVGKFFSSQACRIDVVAAPEELVAQESVELTRFIEQTSFIPGGYLHWNLIRPAGYCDPDTLQAQQASRELVRKSVDWPEVEYPLFALRYGHQFVDSCAEVMAGCGP